MFLSMLLPKPSSYILIYRDTVIPVCFGGIWCILVANYAENQDGIVQKIPIESCTMTSKKDTFS